MRFMEAFTLKSFTSGSKITTAGMTILATLRPIVSAIASASAQQPGAYIPSMSHAVNIEKSFRKSPQKGFPVSTML